MVDTYRIGCVTTDTLTGKACLTPSVVSSIAAGTGSALKLGTAAYQVTAGKTFVITGVRYTTYNTQCAGYLCYADDAALTTNRVSLGFNPLILFNGVFGSYHIPFYATVPSGKYLGVWDGHASSTLTFGLVVVGYEV